MKDVGFGMTVQDANEPDLLPLYDRSNDVSMVFATATLHNRFYFVDSKNIVHDRPMVPEHFEKSINALLDGNQPQKWFRAYLNHGLIRCVYGQKRLLRGDMAFDASFIDPYGDAMPCSDAKDKEVMGNLDEQPGTSCGTATKPIRLAKNAPLRPPVLDDRFRLPGHAVRPLGARALGRTSQVPPVLEKTEVFNV